MVTAKVPLPNQEAGFGTLLLPLLIGQALVTADFTCMNSLNSTIAADLNASLSSGSTASATPAAAKCRAYSASPVA